MSDTMKQRIDAVQASLDELRKTYETENPPQEPPKHGIRVRVGEDADAAFTRALAENAMLWLDPGEHFGNFVVPPDYNGAVTITTMTDRILSIGERPASAEGLAILRAKNPTLPLLTYGLRSTGVHLVGLAIGPQHFDKTVVVFGNDRMVSQEEQPHHIVMSRLYAFGDATRGQHRFCMMGCSDLDLSDSTIVDFHEEGRDSQALAVWNGGRRITIARNFIEAGAENLLLGGGSSRNAEMIPSDIWIKGNHFSKKRVWKDSPADFNNPDIKCLLEVKAGRRIQITGNLFENCWPKNWDSGVAITLKIANQNGLEPWIISEDITFSYNVVRNVGMFMSLVAANDDKKQTLQMRGLRIFGNLAYDIDTPEWPGRGQAFLCSNLPVDTLIDHNTILGAKRMFFGFGYNSAYRPEMLNITNNVVDHGAYGIKGDSGTSGAMGKQVLDEAIGMLKYRMEGNLLRRHPDRTNKLPLGNLILPDHVFNPALDEYMQVRPGAIDLPTTDGKPIGYDRQSLLDAGVPL